jgi:hypothetical protein
VKELGVGGFHKIHPTPKSFEQSDYIDGVLN